MVDKEHTNSLRSESQTVKSYWGFSRRSAGYLMIAPAVIFLLMAIGYPIFDIIRTSLFKYEGLRSQTATFVGLGNFVELMNDKIFWTSAKNTISFTLASIIGHLILGGVFALALSQKWFSQRIRNIVRGLLILPWLFSLAAAALIWALLLNTMGPLNYIFQELGWIDGPLDFLGERDSAMWALVLINIWKAYPFYMIMILGGLQSIPLDVYDAAKVDGANRSQSFWYVTLPLIRDVLVAATAIDFITTFGVFDIVRILTGGGPARTTITLGYYTWSVGFRDVDFGYGAAISVLMLITVAIGALVYLRIANRKESVYA